VAYPAAKPVQAADVPLDCAWLTDPFTALGDDLISLEIIGVFLYLGMCIVNQCLHVQMRHKSLRRRIRDPTGRLPPEVNANAQRAVKVRSHGHPSLELVIIGKILHTPLSEPRIQKYGREFICARKVARCSVHDPNFSLWGNLPENLLHQNPQKRYLLVSHAFQPLGVVGVPSCVHICRFVDALVVVRVRIVVHRVASRLRVNNKELEYCGPFWV